MTDSAVLTWVLWLVGCEVVAGMSQAVLPRKEPRRDFEMSSGHSDREVGSAADPGFSALGVSASS